MARKKKTIEENVTVKENEKIIINTKEAYLFQVTPLTDNIKLYKYPVLNNPQGKMQKGKVYNVTCEINYTPIKMYKLNTGYYVIADQNIKKI